MTSNDTLALFVAALLFGVMALRLFELFFLRKKLGNDAQAVQDATNAANAAVEAYEKAKRNYDSGKQPDGK